MTHLFNTARSQKSEPKPIEEATIAEKRIATRAVSQRSLHIHKRPLISANEPSVSPYMFVKEPIFSPGSQMNPVSANICPQKSPEFAPEFK